MKTAQNVPRTGLARAKGEHLKAANEPQPPSELRRWQDRGWRYFGAADTDVRRTWARFGWTTLPNLRGPL